MLQELTFKEIVLDGKSKRPVIQLKDKKNNIFPIYVSEEQARAIIFGTELVDKPTRPFTHDLLADFLTAWSMELEKVIINSINEHSVYIASLIVRQGDTTKEIDCRPSDAIALAVRIDCPIFAPSALITDSSMAA